MRGILPDRLRPVSAEASPPHAPALRADGIVKRFGEREALRGVSFEARSGEVLAVIGPNGAGKTTLLEIVAGAQEPDAGSVTRPAGGVGWVPQRLSVYTRLTVEENLRLFARLEKLERPQEAVARMLDITGLRERAGDTVDTLSGGNRQRVNVAVGLLSSPDVVLLDEPSAALDPRQRARFWVVAERLVEEGAAVLFTTHDVAEAERHADRVLVIADGDMLFDGTAQELRAAGHGEPGEDLEPAVVRFLKERGH
jgi:ABC-2 type transport system ATP-binding protein